MPPTSEAKYMGLFSGNSRVVGFSIDGNGVLIVNFLGAPALTPE
jgi:hypothetical protein